MSARREWSGALDQRVQFERRSDARGLAGDWSGEWQLVAERWAAVIPVAQANLSSLVADTRHSARRWRIEIRSDIMLDVGMRALWRGLQLRISGVEEDPATPDRLTVIAEEFAL